MCSRVALPYFQLVVTLYKPLQFVLIICSLFFKLEKDETELEKEKEDKIKAISEKEQQLKKELARLRRTKRLYKTKQQVGSKNFQSFQTIVPWNKLSMMHLPSSEFQTVGGNENWRLDEYWKRVYTTQP